MKAGYRIYPVKSCRGRKILQKKSANDNPALKVNIALWAYAFLVTCLSGVGWLIFLHHRRFYLRPLFAADDRFRDLTNYTGKTAHLLGGAATLGHGLPVYTYPAPAAFVYKALIYSFPGHAARTYFCFLATASELCLCGVARQPPHAEGSILRCRRDLHHRIVWVYAYLHRSTAAILRASYGYWLRLDFAFYYARGTAPQPC